MIIKEIVVSKFEVNVENKNVSIRTDTVIKEDGVELSRSHHRCAFVPGDIDAATECLGSDSPEVAYLSALWTPEVVAAHKAKQEAQEI